MNHNHMQRAGLLAMIALLATTLLGLTAASGQSMPAGGATQMGASAGDTPSPDAALATQNPVPDWSIYSAGAMDDAGDVNGDGYDDVILIGLASPSVGASARIHFGSADGLSNAANWTVELPNITIVGGIGDVNGDGYADVLIKSASTLLVYHGSPTGPPAASHWSIGGNVRPAGYTGDVNGDGFDDLLVGDPGYSNGQTYEGLLAVYFGSPSGLGTSAGWTLEGGVPERYLGSVVAAVGDVNKDGCDDVVAASVSGSSRLHEIYLGSPAGPATSPSWSTLIPYEYSVATAGDVNCDDFDDVIVGMPDLYYPPSRGQALVYAGSPSGVGADPAWRLESDRSSAQFGRAAVAAGDVNGDGCGDVVIGAPNYASNTAGYLFVYMGSPQGLSLIPQWRAFRLTGGAGFGTAASTAGDVNGDGHDEVLGAHPADRYFAGAVYGFNGSAAGLRETVFAAQRTSQPPVIDGDLGEWEPTARFTLDITSAETIQGEPPSVEDAAAWVRARWDLLNLYLAIHVSDDAIVNDSGDVWHDDEIELGFYAVYDGDPAGHDTHQYTINPDGRVTDFGNPAVPVPIETAVRIVPGGWNVELRIPHTHLFGFYHPFSAGLTLSFNVGLHDDDDGGDWDSYLVWQGSSTITNGDAFGQMLLVIPDAPLPPTPTPTATPRSTPTPTVTQSPTPTTSPTPTAPPSPGPDLQYSFKSARPAAVAPDEPIVYTITLYNSGRAQGLITLIDVPPLPYVPDSAGGGLAWDPVTASLRWRGTMLPGDWHQFGYTLAGPSVCVPPGTVYTNTLTIDDGYHPPFTRAASVVVASGPTPWASCTPTSTATATPTATSTATATPVVVPMYLPLILHQ